MKSEWNRDDNCRIYKCPVCGYTYHDYYDERSGSNPEKPFIESIDGVNISIPREYAPDKVVRATRYICPECGVVQVDVNEID